MDKERENTMTGKTQISVRRLSKISDPTKSGSALLILLIVVIAIGLLIYFSMSSAIFKSEFPKGKPKAEVKINTEEELIAVIERIVKKGEDINAEQNRNKETLLHLAVAKGYAKAVKLLLDNNANVNARDVMDATPLHSAVLEDKIEIVRLLITNGADLNAVSDYLSTPLHIAASRGKVEIAKLLLEKGANVNAKDKVGITPLTAAMILQYEHLMKGNNTTPERQREIIEILRAHGGKE